MLQRLGKGDLAARLEFALGRLKSVMAVFAPGADDAARTLRKHLCRAARAVRFLKMLKPRFWWACDA